MKKACSVCGAQQENEDVAADRNPSFLKKMATSSMSSLRLPLSFVKNQIDNLDNVVVLEGPGKGKWKVELQGSFQSFSLNFGPGWAKFVADHVLQIDDLLIFSLSAKYYFQVEVYDGGGCQKTSALDAEGAETVVAEAARPVQEARFVAEPERFVAEAKTFVQDFVEIAEIARPVAEVVEAERSVEHVAEAARPVAEVAVAVRSEGLDDPDSGDGSIKLAKKDRGGHHMFKGNVISRRRVVTELETEQALQAAKVLELANPNLLLVMSAQNVYKGFWLGIPKQFAKEWMPKATTKVALVNKGGHSWPVKWIAGRGGISAGWRRFSLDHCLEEDDVLVFELIDKANYVLLVHVFRVLGCPGEDSRLNTPALSSDQSVKRESPNEHEADGTPGGASERKRKHPYRDFPVDKHILGPESETKRFQSNSRLLGDGSGAPGDEAAIRGCSGAPGVEPGVRAAERSPTAPQEVSAPVSSGGDGHEADGTPGETSEPKRKPSRRDVQADKHALEPDSARKSFKRIRRLLGEQRASPAKRKELAIPNHEELGTKEAELLIHLIHKKPVDQVSPKNRASNDARHEAALRATVAGDEVALGAHGAEDEDENNAAEGVTPVAPRQGLALLCSDNGKTPGKKQSGTHRGAERPSSARECVNPDDVHEQILFATATGVPFTRKKPEKRKEYKVVQIYSGRNVGSETEYLTQLEGCSERRSFAPLERDEDTGFWWVPCEQFHWKMEHCYLE